MSMHPPPGSSLEIQPIFNQTISVYHMCAAERAHASTCSCEECIFVKYFAELRKQSLATTLLTIALVFVLQVDPKGKVIVQSLCLA